MMPKRFGPLTAAAVSICLPQAAAYILTQRKFQGLQDSPLVDCTGFRQHRVCSTTLLSSPASKTTRTSDFLTEDSSPIAKSIVLGDAAVSQQQENIAVQKKLSEQALQDQADNNVYRNGIITVAVITVLFASNSPAIHAAFVEVSSKPPVLLLNGSVSSIALLGLALGGPLLDKFIPEPTLLNKSTEEGSSTNESLSEVSGDEGILQLSDATWGGLELGMWKFLGTTANLFGLSLTSADHGAFLIQLTTLFVPAAQGLMGVPIPARIWTAIVLALGGVFAFTQDPAAAGSTTWQGDILCVVAAVFYATYDLRLFQWGKRVAPLDLITSKVGTQALLSVGTLCAMGLSDTIGFLSTASAHDLAMVAAVVLWSGIIVNGVVPYLQVGGQQAVGPARAQIMYASQPLWAAIMSFFFLSERVGPEGFIGGTAFLAAIMLAATTEPPNPDCDDEVCEV